MIEESAPFATGIWGQGISWELHYSTVLPPTELITAVFCVALTTDGRVVLARSKRGWGLLGGHMEDGETPEAALVRETKEEGGFVPTDPQPFAYRKVIATRPLPHQTPGKHYPFPYSYLAYYWATSKEPLGEPTGAEIIESAAFTLEAAEALNTPDFPIIQAGFVAASARHAGQSAHSAQHL